MPGIPFGLNSYQFEMIHSVFKWQKVLASKKNIACTILSQQNATNILKALMLIRNIASILSEGSFQGFKQQDHLKRCFEAFKCHQVRLLLRKKHSKE